MKKLLFLLITILNIASSFASESSALELSFSSKLAIIAQEIVLLPARICNAMAVKNLAPVAKLLKESQQAALHNSAQKWVYYVAERAVTNILPLTASVLPYFYCGVKAARSRYMREKAGPVPSWLMQTSLFFYTIHVGDLLSGYVYEPLKEEPKPAEKTGQKYTLTRVGNNRFIAIPLADR